MRLRGLNNKIIVMNVARYGSNSLTWQGYAYEGPELIEIAHDGVEVIIQAINCYYDPSARRTLTKTNKPAPNILECGRIPLQWIEDISTEGDEFDGSAIFFVRYRASGRRPYKYITYRESTSTPFGPNQRDYHQQIDELGIRRPQRIRDWLHFIKQLRQSRKMDATLR